MDFIRNRRQRSRRAQRGLSTGAIERLESRSMMTADLLVTPLPSPPANTGALVFMMSNEQGSGGGETNAPVTIPGVPTGLEAKAGDGRVALSWKAPTDAGGATRLCYVVQVSTDGGTTWTTINRRFEEPGAIIGDLKNGQAYVFHVAAVNKAGMGTYSASSASVTPTGPAIPLPGTPTSLKAVASEGKVKLSWTPPTNTGGAERLAYVVQVSNDGGSTWTTITRRFDEPRALIVGLAAGKSYVFRVAAVNKAGQGVFSAPSAAVTLAASGSSGGTNRR